MWALRGPTMAGRKCETDDDGEGPAALSSLDASLIAWRLRA